jgi:hypothetical protein
MFTDEVIQKAVTNRIKPLFDYPVLARLCNVETAIPLVAVFIFVCRTTAAAPLTGDPCLQNQAPGIQVPNPVLSALIHVSCWLTTPGVTQIAEENVRIAEKTRAPVSKSSPSCFVWFALFFAASHYPLRITPCASL